MLNIGNDNILKIFYFHLFHLNAQFRQDSGLTAELLYIIFRILISNDQN
jgi:hypothetical protein